MFEKTGKCPLCNRTLRMKNGRMACEDCGYVLNMHNESDYSLNSNSDKNTNRNTGTTGNFNYNSAQTSYSERNDRVNIDRANIDRANIDRADRLKRSRIIMLMVIAIIWILIMFMSIVSGLVADKSYNEYKEYSVDYLDSIEDINSIINKNNNIEVLNMDRIPDSELYQNFVTEVFGEDYTIVSPKQYASITYLHVYYYEDKIEYAIDDGEIQEFWYDSSLYGDIDDDIKCFTGLKYLNIEKDKFYYMDALDGLTQLTEVWSGNTVEEL